MPIPLGRMIVWQSAALVVGGVILGAFAGLGAAVAAGYGGGVAVAGQALLVWRWHEGTGEPRGDARRHLRTFYRSSLERFFLVALSLALWFVLVKAKPLAVLGGFLAGQLAGMAASVAVGEGA